MQQGKSNIKRYILIGAVVAIWAVIVYKIIDFINSDDSSVVDIPYTEKKATEKMKEAKDYTLLLNYSDPFLKESVDKTAAIEPITVAIMEVGWPSLAYSGYLKNDKSMVGVLVLNGNHQLVKKGDIIEDIKIVELYEDSIRLRYKNDLRTFIR